SLGSFEVDVLHDNLYPALYADDVGYLLSVPYPSAPYSLLAVVFDFAFELGGQALSIADLADGMPAGNLCGLWFLGIVQENFTVVGIAHRPTTAAASHRAICC